MDSVPIHTGCPEEAIDLCWGVVYVCCIGRQKEEMMFKGFKEFITRGNLPQIAVAFLIGMAFAALVSSFINDLIMPLIGKLVGNVDFANLYINMSGVAYESAAAAREAGAAAIYYGSFINSIANFLIIALVAYMILRYVQRMQKAEEPAPATTKACPYCKTAIPLDAVRCPHCTSELSGS